MKIVALGDIHGRPIWKQIVERENADMTVFLADYFDSFDILPQEQKDNFRDIIAYKKANMDKVVLLFGNHDYHYMFPSDQTYSGFQTFQYIDFQELLRNAISENLIQMCWRYENILFTHAGVTKTWCRDNDIDISNIDESINDLFKYKPYKFRFTMGLTRNKNGDDICQTPIWVRPFALSKDKIDNFIQVVGHTSQYNIEISNDIILIDTLGTTGEYLKITDGAIASYKL